MARPIKDTPILYGKEAEVFEKQITDNLQRTIPPTEINRMLATYRSIKFIDKTNNEHDKAARSLSGFYYNMLIIKTIY